MAKQAFFIVTANRTDDGGSVYRTESGTWSPQLSEAFVHGDKASATAALELAQAEERQVCDPYVVSVALDDRGRPQPDCARERIRSAGPSVRVRRPDSSASAL